jgi:ankyrin repeat protein
MVMSQVSVVPTDPHAPEEIAGNLTSAALRADTKKVRDILSQYPLKRFSHEIPQILSSAVASQSLEVLTLLLDSGADAYLNQGEHLPLTRAIENGDYPMVDLLLSRGANPGAKTGQPVMTLITSEHHGLYELVLSHARFDTEDPQNSLYIIEAILQNRGEVLYGLLKAGAGFTHPCLYAISDATTARTKEQLSHALLGDESEAANLFCALLQGSMKAIGRLEGSAHLTRAFPLALSPLMVSLYSSKGFLTRHLLRREQRINHADIYGMTGLHHLLRLKIRRAKTEPYLHPPQKNEHSMGPAFDLVSMFLEAGADPTIPDRDGITPALLKLELDQVLHTTTRGRE